MADKPTLVSRVKELGTKEALATDPRFEKILENVYPLTGEAGKQRTTVNTLGEGTFGRVNLEELNEGLVATKYFLEPEDTINENIAEVAAMKYIKDMPYLAQLIHVDPRPTALAVNAIAPSIAEDLPFPALVMGKAIGTLDEKKHFKSWDDLFNATKEILLGYHVLHSNGLVHRDTKPENMLMTADREVWISDLGMARYIDKNIPITLDRYTGTYWYASPEILLNNMVDIGIDDYVKSDIWAVGTSIVQVLCGSPIFTGDNIKEVLRNIFRTLGAPTATDGRTFELFKEAETYAHLILKYKHPSKKDAIVKHILANVRYMPTDASILVEIANLIGRMTDLDPAKRPSLAEVLSSPVFNAKLDRLPTRPLLLDDYAFSIPLSTGIKAHFFDILLEWIYHMVALAKDDFPFTQASSRVVLDRTGCYLYQFMNVYKDHPFITTRNLQLIGGTSFFIACALFDESKYAIVSLEKLVDYTAKSYTEKEVLDCIKMFMTGNIKFYGRTMYDLIAGSGDYTDAELDTIALLNYICYQKNLFGFYKDDIPILMRKIVEFGGDHMGFGEYLKQPAFKIKYGKDTPEAIEDFVDFVTPKEGGRRKATRKAKKSVKKRGKTRAH